MEHYINENPSLNAVPVYFDVKSQTTIHKNTPEVYLNIAALLAKKMCELQLVNEGEFKIARRCMLDISTDVLDMKVQMSSWHIQYQQDALFSLADAVNAKGKYVLLLLDEIDALLLEALNSPSDFGRIRGAATDSSRKLKFWIAGTAPWKSITTNIGSPELNCGLEAIRLSKIDKSDFDMLWSDECSLIDDSCLKDKLLSIKDEIYKKTAGIPYYAKFIGSSFINGTIEKLPDYTILRDYLCEIYENRFMTESERSTLHILADGPKPFDAVPDDINSLITKGLVLRDGDFYSIAFGYLADYIQAKSSNALLHDTVDIEQKERDILVDQIMRLRNTVKKKMC